MPHAIEMTISVSVNKSSGALKIKPLNEAAQALQDLSGMDGILLSSLQTPANKLGAVFSVQPPEFAVLISALLADPKSVTNGGTLPPLHPEPHMATADEIDRARSMYGSDVINIDDDALVSRGDDVTWVQAWVDIS